MSMFTFIASDIQLPEVDLMRIGSHQMCICITE